MPSGKWTHASPASNWKPRNSRLDVEPGSWSAKSCSTLASTSSSSALLAGADWTVAVMGTAYGVHARRSEGRCQVPWQPVRTWTRLLLIALLAGVGLAAIVIAVALPVEALANHGANSVDNAIANINAPRSERSTVYASDGSVLAILHSQEDRVPVSIDQVPPDVVNAVVDTEDSRFFTHGAVDLTRPRRNGPMPAHVGTALFIGRTWMTPILLRTLAFGALLTGALAFAPIAQAQQTGTSKGTTSGPASGASGTAGNSTGSAAAGNGNGTTIGGAPGQPAKAGTESGPAPKKGAASTTTTKQ